MWTMKSKNDHTVFHVHGESLGQRLCRLRQTQEMTQRDLAQMSGISTRALCSYERDQCEPPAHNLPKLADALGVSTDEILGLTPCTEVQKQGRISRRWSTKFEQIDQLTERKQRAIMQVLDMALQQG